MRRPPAVSGHAGTHQQGHDVARTDVFPDRPRGLGAVQQEIEGCPQLLFDGGMNLLSVDPGPGQLVGEVLFLDRQLCELSHETEQGLARVRRGSEFFGPLDKAFQVGYDDGLEQGLLGGEVPVNSANAYTGPGGNDVDGHCKSLRGEDLFSSLEDPVNVPPGIGATGGRLLLGTRISGGGRHVTDLGA